MPNGGGNLGIKEQKKNRGNPYDRSIGFRQFQATAGEETIGVGKMTANRGETE